MCSNINRKMLLKVPSGIWSEQYQQHTIAEESVNESDDGPDFAEYLWMENEEEFDKTELQRLEDEELMKDCIDAMVDDEIEAQIIEWEKLKCERLKTAISLLPMTECDVAHSVLNPLATEFIPQSQNKYVINAATQHATYITFCLEQFV